MGAGTRTCWRRVGRCTRSDQTRGPSSRRSCCRPAPRRPRATSRSTCSTLPRASARAGGRWTHWRRCIAGSAKPANGRVSCAATSMPRRLNRSAGRWSPSPRTSVPEHGWSANRAGSRRGGHATRRPTRGIRSAGIAPSVRSCLRSTWGWWTSSASSSPTRPSPTWVWRGAGREVGRRFDHVFASPTLRPWTFRYRHDWRERDASGDRLSDHSGVVATFGPMAD